MHSTSRVRWAVLLFAVLLSGTSVFASEIDDYIPEVTDRVARISFVQGDVQIRRADSQDWEVAVLNLPIVEGDELATDGNGRFEIQFNSYTHLRVAENSQIKFVGLQDSGIALSVPLGTVVLRASEFDGTRSFFEIDAPKTTISIQKAGMYRIEAGVPDSLEVIVSATDGGEARVYSADAGFTVKNGRRAKIYIGGSQSGEWETADAGRFIDEFDKWALDRDAIIAQRIRDSYYDKYYDRDIYGAEDLNDYGEWIHTRKYGYVWRPYSSAVSQYADWSPYRYGHWRWVPPYGWTWVNDEPWGWATYHHGRWVWDNGAWYWTPYGYYRHSRSWWHPALVVIRVLGNNVCWYPLPYNYGYYNYNAYYNSHHRRRRRHNNNNYGGGTGNPGTPVAALPGVKAGTPAQNPNTNQTSVPSQPGVKTRVQAPLSEVPPTGVVTVATSEFGRGKGNFKTPPLAMAKSVLSVPPETGQPTPILPTYGDLNGKVAPEIKAVRPPMVRTSTDVRTGASVRNPDVPLDQELQKSRIFGGRPPLQINTNQGEIKTGGTIDSGPRKTGAVERPPIQRDVEGNRPRQMPGSGDAPIYVPPTRQQDDEQNTPIRVPRSDPPMTRDEPRNPPVRTPRYDPPPVRDDPPVRHQPPPVRNDPPPRNDPPVRNNPPPRNDPPPTKSDPPATKDEPSKPTPPIDRKKDGR